MTFFVPPGLASDREQANRASMFLVSHTMGPVLGNSVPLALYLLDPTPGPEIALLCASISLFWLFPFLLRSGVSYDRLVCLSVLNLNFCILFSCYRYGGIASPTLSWVLIVPILSLFYIGGERQLQPRLLAISGGALATFFLALVLVPAEPHDLPDAAVVGLGVVSTVASLSYVATMAIYYARIFDAGLDLEIEVERRRALAAELRQAIVEIHKSGSAKAEFLARMSGEMCAPVRAILSAGSELRADAAGPEDTPLREDVDRILLAARYLDRLINMILDLARLNAGGAGFDLQFHDVRTLVNTVVAARQEDIRASGSRLEVRIDEELCLAEVDARRVAQLMDALLENAAEHTRYGRIRVEVLRSGEGEGLTISVGDTGVGIVPEVMNTLFTGLDATRDAEARSRFGGTGLSLTVCSHLCRAMGGQISVESQVGAGSTFTILLPARLRLRRAGQAEVA